MDLKIWGVEEETVLKIIKIIIIRRIPVDKLLASTRAVDKLTIMQEASQTVLEIIQHPGCKAVEATGKSKSIPFLIFRDKMGSLGSNMALELDFKI